MSITLFATVKAKPETANNVERALAQMIAPTRAEPGCIRYELFRSETNVNTFHLVETYVDQQAVDFHNQSAHFTALVANLADKLTSGIQIEHLVKIDT